MMIQDIPEGNNYPLSDQESHANRHPNASSHQSTFPSTRLHPHPPQHHASRGRHRRPILHAIKNAFKKVIHKAEHKVEHAINKTTQKWRQSHPIAAGLLSEHSIPQGAVKVTSIAKLRSSYRALIITDWKTLQV